MPGRAQKLETENGLIEAKSDMLEHEVSDLKLELKQTKEVADSEINHLETNLKNSLSELFEKEEENCNMKQSFKKQNDEILSHKEEVSKSEKCLKEKRKKSKDEAFFLKQEKKSLNTN